MRQGLVSLTERKKRKKGVRGAGQGEGKEKKNTKHPACTCWATAPGAKLPCPARTPFPGAARQPADRPAPGRSRQPLARPFGTLGLRRATWPSSQGGPGAAAPQRAPRAPSPKASGRPRRGWGAAGPADQSHCVRIVLPFWPATWHKGGGRVCTWHCPGLFSEGQPRTPETALASGTGAATSLRTATPGSDGQRESSRPRSPGPPPPARIPGWPPRAGAAPRAPGPAGAKRRLRALPRPPHAPLLARAAPSWAVGPSGARPRG